MIAKFNAIILTSDFEMSDWRIKCGGAEKKDFLYVKFNGDLCNEANRHASEIRFLSSTGVWSKKEE